MCCQMAEIPSFFNRLDFIGVFLPGYVTVLAYVALFRPDLIIGKAPLQADIFSAIFFIVAGPATGIALRQLHRGVLAGINSQFGKTKRYKKSLEKYARIRLNMNEREKTELDEVLAYYDSSISLGTGLAVISIATLITRGLVELGVTFSLGFVALLFFFGGYYMKKTYYTPLLLELAKKYP